MTTELPHPGAADPPNTPMPEPLPVPVGEPPIPVEMPQPPLQVQAGQGIKRNLTCQ